MGETDFVAVKDASMEGVGGFIVGNTKECIPTVFWMQWPEDIKQEVAKQSQRKVAQSQTLIWSWLVFSSCG